MLAVEADLIAESSGLRISVNGNGKVLTCRLDAGTGTLLDIVRRSRHLLPALRAIIPLLVRSGLVVDVVAGKRRVAHIGLGVKQNAVSRLLRLPSTRIGA